MNFSAEAGIAIALRHAKSAPRRQCGSPFLQPRPQHDFERPSRSVLAMQLQIGFRDAVRVGHVVVDRRTCPTVRAGTVFLSPTDRRIDRHIGNV